MGVAALAVGLAFAERSGEETIDCLIDLAVAASPSWRLRGSASRHSTGSTRTSSTVP